ncbi:MAG: TonB-dependent receptor [Myxococcales bacterium]|nr:TonB-dependent receptor [Myxococcales bacterium]
MSKRPLPCLLLLALTIASPPALAHDDGDAPPTEVVRVVGERAVEATSKIVVPADEFDLRPLESGGQMLEAVPGALTAQHTGGGKAEQYFLRGFDADHGTDLSVRFDGVPVNLRTHAHGQGYIDLHFVTRETIERLAVGKGPYSAREGDFATAAAIDYVPYDSLDRSLVLAEGGMFDTWRVVGAASPRFGAFATDDADAVFSLEAYHTDGPFRSDEDLTRISVFGRGSAAVTDSLRLFGHVVGYDADWNASGLVPRRLVEDGTISRFGSVDPTEGGRSTRVQGKAGFEWTPTSLDRLTAFAYLVHYDLDLFSNFTFALNDPVNGDGIVQKDDRLYAGGVVELEHALDGMLDGALRAGVETRWDAARVRLGRQTARAITGFTSDDDVEEWSAAPWAELELLPLPWVRLVGGARYEVFGFDVQSHLPGGPRHRGDDRIWLPKASLVLTPFRADGALPCDWQPLSDLELFLSYGTGFHSNDVRAAATSDRILARAPGAEVGIHTHLAPHVSISVTGFWLELESELAFVGDEGTTEAGGRTRRLGVEAAARADLTPWLYVRGDVAFTDARTTSNDERIAQAPRFIAKGAIGVEYEGFRAELAVKHLGERRAEEGLQQPTLSDYTVLDLGASYAWDAVEVGLAIENLTDAKWRSSEFYFASCVAGEVCTGASDFHFTPGNPINLRGFVRYAF